MRVKDRNLKKRAQLEPKGIKYKTLLASGVENTPENRQRYLNGEALNLLIEQINLEQAQQAQIETAKEQEIKYDPVMNKVFLEEQALAEALYLETYLLEQEAKGETNG